MEGGLCESGCALYVVEVSATAWMFSTSMILKCNEDVRYLTLTKQRKVHQTIFTRPSLTYRISVRPIPILSWNLLTHVT